MKKIFYLALAASLTLSSVSTTFAKGVSVPNSTNKTISQPNKINTKSETLITSKAIKTKANGIEVDIKIPVINGLKDKKVQDKINVDLEKASMEYKSTVESEAEFAKKEGYFNNNFSIHSDYKIHYNKGNLLSITISSYIYTGGAHGMTYVTNFNIDTKSGENVSLKDFFSPNENYVDIINKAVRDKIASTPNYYFEDIVQRFKGILPDQPFYIENDNVVVYFGLYELAPYAAGIQEFKVPFKSFKNGVKTDLNFRKDAIKVSSKVVDELELGYRGNLRIPVIKGLKDEKMQTAINSKFEKEALEFNNKLKKDGMDYAKECEKLKIEQRDFFGDTDYYVYQNHNNILSITVLYEQYTGGAHGSYNKTPYNIDLKTGKEITIKDVFKPGVNYKDIINKEINKQIDVINKKADTIQIQGFTGISENQDFYINNGNIVVYFQPYAIAPYCMGIQEFTISLDNFKTMVKPEFLVK
ncbi:PdaC/SigV domain-containing protein [Clostridium lundense]|uniref:PdaC/SigV domain-containing protein n=1 Tax=Clostridium lundense TaxID=319475 RepID=UPI00048579A9|nr:DUF4163 domain-containing protein [Clostridium lundense]